MLLVVDSAYLVGLDIYSRVFLWRRALGRPGSGAAMAAIMSSADASLIPPPPSADWMPVQAI